MRQQCSRSQVIWYDAITTEGSLTWQNTLNELNRPFFDAADAIFINYSWKVCSLQQQSSLNACVLGARKCD